MSKPDTLADRRGLALLAYQEACQSPVADWQAVAHLLAACFPKEKRGSGDNDGVKDAQSSFAPFKARRALGEGFSLADTYCEVTFADGVTVRPSALAWGGRHIDAATGARAAVGRYRERMRDPETYLGQVPEIASMKLLSDIGESKRDFDPEEANRATEACRAPLVFARPVKIETVSVAMRDRLAWIMDPCTGLIARRRTIEDAQAAFDGLSRDDWGWNEKAPVRDHAPAELVLT